MRRPTLARKRRAEADFFKLFDGVSPTPARDRLLLDRLFETGVTARSAARVLCASHSSDPFACARTVADKPRPSLAGATPVFEAEPRWVGSPKVRIGSHSVTLATHPASAVIGRTEESTVAWNTTEEVNPFLLVVGGSGSGKTELLKRIASEVLAGGCPVVLFDVHGDLGGVVTQQKALGSQLGINPLQLVGEAAHQARDFVETVRQAVPDLGKVQAYELGEVLRPLLRSKKASLRTLWQELQNMQQQGGAERRRAVGLLASLDSIFGEPVFSASRQFDLADLLVSGTRLDLTSLGRPAQVIAVETILRFLFERFKVAGSQRQKGLRLLAICDEASLLQGSKTLHVLFREARKFGLGLVLASQLSADFDETLRGNAGALIALRSNSAKDRLANARELGVQSELLRQLERPGQALYRGSGGLIQFQALRVGERSDGIDPQQIKAGSQHELEHTDDPKRAESIAADHPREIPDYYRRLDRLESAAKRPKSKRALSKIKQLGFDL